MGWDRPVQCNKRRTAISIARVTALRYVCIISQLSPWHSQLKRSVKATPSMRDIIFHTQWCAGLAMVAVQWPGFACKSHFAVSSTNAVAQLKCRSHFEKCGMGYVDLQ